jgi:hypothetical protein
MKRTRLSDNKKKIGRPATGVGTLVGQRWRDDQLEQIERWRRAQQDQPGRSEAIRRLVEIGLGKETGKALPSHRLQAAHADRAKELARNTIEKIGDPSASPEERTERRRKLTRGPQEFREDRVDSPKSKK